MKFLIAALALGAAPMFAGACPTDFAGEIREGHYGAKSVRAYRELVALQSEGRDEALTQLVEAGRLVPLPAGRVACIRFGSRVSYRHRVTVPGIEGTLWVHLQALDY